MTAETELPETEAWDTEMGDIVVWGTHDPIVAKNAYVEFARRNDAEIDEDFLELDFSYADKFWGAPHLRDQEVEWEPQSFSTEPVEGWIPYLVEVFLP